MNTKNLYLCVVTAAVLAFAGAASAGTYSGTLLVSNPATAIVGGAAEIVTPCDEDSALNGTDGVWFDISGDAGTSFTLTMDATLDADVWWYSAGCAFISDSSGAQNGLGATESGSVPSGAAYAIVDNFAGAGDFTLTLS